MTAGGLPVYGLNLLLHAALLSCAALAVTSCFRNPNARSFSAALGLLALSVIPCISATRVPAKPTAVSVPGVVLRIPEPAVLTVNSPVHVADAAAAETTAKPATRPTFKAPGPWTWIVSIWALGSAVRITRWVVTSLRFARWKRSLRPPTAAELRILRETLPTSGMSVSVRVSETGSSPCVAGIFRAALILPADLLDPQRGRELGWALRHEAGHLRGHDLRWLAGFQLILTVFWWNPIAHRLVRIWSEAREQACDNLAVADPRDRECYGAFLVSLGARRMGGNVLAMADRGSVARLKRRLSFLMQSRPCRPCGRPFLASGTLAALVAGLAVSQLGVRAETPAPQSQAAVETKLPGKKHDTIANAKPEDRAETHQIKFTTRFIVAARPFMKDGTILNENMWQIALRALSKTKGVELMTAPSVTARAGQNTMIEMIREKPGKPDTDGAQPFAGIRLGYLADPSGDEIGVKYNLSIAHVPGTALGESHRIPAGEIPWDKLRVLHTEGENTLGSFEFLCVSAGEIDPGRHLTMIVSADRIDATGRPVAAGGQALTPPNPAFLSIQSPGTLQSALRLPLPPFRLFADGWLATLPNDVVKDIVSDSSASPPHLVNADGQKLHRALERARSSDILTLPSVETKESPVPHALWESLPDFRASHTRSDLPHLASFWWTAGTELAKPDGVTGSLGLVGDDQWCFELPSTTPDHRRILLLRVRMEKR